MVAQRTCNAKVVSSILTIGSIKKQYTERVYHMDDYRVPTDEQETVIQFDRNGTVCHVYTTDPTMMTKLDKVHKRVKQDYVNGKPIAAYYEFDKKFITFRKSIPKNNQTKEQRKHASDRMKKLRRKQLNP